jgi:hypothetical protein
MILLFLVPLSAQALSCTFRNSCLPGEADMLHLYQLTDSHAELPNQTIYANRLCCGDLPGITNIQQGVRYRDYDVILNLYLQTDSHVQQSDQSGYGYGVYISSDLATDEVRCQYTAFPSQDCSSFGPDYTCLMTIDKVTNSHVSDCDGSDDFPIKVCCMAVLDVTAPDFTLTEPSSQWTNSTSFTVSWTGAMPYDFNCFNVLWSSDPTEPWEGKSWDTIYDGSMDTACTTEESITFGPNQPVVVSDGITYYFTGHSVDTAGNEGVNVTPVNTTVDLTPPDITVSVRNQLGTLITDGVVPAGTTSIIINFSSTDGVSGISDSFLSYNSTRNGVSSIGTVSCPASSPWGGWSNCSAYIPYDTETRIRFHVSATDRAGNAMVTENQSLTSHPISSFSYSNITIIMGDEKLMPVIVTNSLDRPDKISINISGYPFSYFESLCSPGECEVSADKKILTINDMSPKEERVYYVRIISTHTGFYSLSIHANSTADPLLTDSDTLGMVISYPSYFPDFGLPAILLLLLASALAYPRLSRRT